MSWICVVQYGSHGHLWVLDTWNVANESEGMGF